MQSANGIALSDQFPAKLARPLEQGIQMEFVDRVHQRQVALTGGFGQVIH